MNERTTERRKKNVCVLFANKMATGFFFVFKSDISISFTHVQKYFFYRVKFNLLIAFHQISLEKNA